MGLADDLYTLLNTDWDASIIAKSTFHKNEQNPRPEPRHIFLNAQDQGVFIEDASDNTLDQKVQNFKITIYEGNNADVEKSIQAVKKAIHTKEVTSGYYHIDSFLIEEKNQLCSCELQGRLTKFIGASEF